MLGVIPTVLPPPRAKVYNLHPPNTRQRLETAIRHAADIQASYCPNPERACQFDAPAVGGARRREAAGMARARTNLCECEPAGHGYRRSAARNGVGRAPSDGTQLRTGPRARAEQRAGFGEPNTIRTPAICNAAGGDRARVRGTDVHRCEAHWGQ